MSERPLSSIPPTETLEISKGLSLVPRVKLLLTVNRSDLSVKLVDEWKLKRSLLDFLKTSNIVPEEEDLEIRRFKDVKKRKREDPVASGALYIRDLGFLTKKKRRNLTEEEEKEAEDFRVLEKKFLEWRDSFAKKLDGIELSIEGAKFKLDAVVPEVDDFYGLKKTWEEFHAFSSKGNSSRGGRQQPDTLVLRGVPSRWFAEPIVSSKPSMLVTHTIFSVFGQIRRIDVAGDDDLGRNAEGDEEIVSGLHCKIVVQFEKHDDFCNALKVLCGRSMQKQGSRLRADYEATWDRDDFFRNYHQGPARNQIQDRSGRSQGTAGQYNSEAPRYQSSVARFGSGGASSKRFKD